MSEIHSVYGAFAVGWWKIGLFIPEFWFGTCETWFNGTVKRAFTANKWSRRAIKLFTCSSKRMFSERSWCKHDNNDATENNSKFISFVSIKKFQIVIVVLKGFLLSKCCACSIKNCDPCSHWRSRSCSRLCGVFPWAVGWPVPPSIELNDGPCGWLAALLRAYIIKIHRTLEKKVYILWWILSSAAYICQLFARENWSGHLWTRIHTRWRINTVRFHLHEQLIGHFLSNTARRVQLIAQHMCDMHVFRWKQFHIFCAIVCVWMISFVWFGNFRIWRAWRRILNFSARCNRCHIVDIRLGFKRDF